MKYKFNQNLHNSSCLCKNQLRVSPILGIKTENTKKNESATSRPDIEASSHDLINMTELQLEYD